MPSPTVTRVMKTELAIFLRPTVSNPRYRLQPTICGRCRQPQPDAAVSLLLNALDNARVALDGGGSDTDRAMDDPARRTHARTRHRRRSHPRARASMPAPGRRRARFEPKSVPVPARRSGAPGSAVVLGGVAISLAYGLYPAHRSIIPLAACGLWHSEPVLVAPVADRHVRRYACAIRRTGCSASPASESMASASTAPAQAGPELAQGLPPALPQPAGETRSAQPGQPLQSRSRDRPCRR